VQLLVANGEQEFESEPLHVLLIVHVLLAFSTLQEFDPAVEHVFVPQSAIAEAGTIAITAAANTARMPILATSLLVTDSAPSSSRKTLNCVRYVLDWGVILPDCSLDIAVFLNSVINGLFIAGGWLGC